MQERLLFYGRTAEPYFFYEPIDVAPTQLGVSGKGSHLFLIRPYTWQGRLLTKEFKVKKKSQIDMACSWIRISWNLGSNIHTQSILHYLIIGFFYLLKWSNLFSKLLN